MNDFPAGNTKKIELLDDFDDYNNEDVAPTEIGAVKADEILSNAVNDLATKTQEVPEERIFDFGVSEPKEEVKPVVEEVVEEDDDDEEVEEE